MTLALLLALLLWFDRDAFFGVLPLIIFGVLLMVWMIQKENDQKRKRERLRVRQREREQIREMEECEREKQRSRERQREREQERELEKNRMNACPSPSFSNQLQLECTLTNDRSDPPIVLSNFELVIDTRRSESESAFELLMSGYDQTTKILSRTTHHTDCR